MVDKPAPQPTPETEPFWAACRQGELRLQHCDACQEFVFYPRDACPRCGSARLEWTGVSGRARLLSFVISHLPAPGYEPPYVIAVVELAEGPRMLTNIVGIPPEPDSLILDMPLTVEFEERGEQSVPVFAPVPEAVS